MASILLITPDRGIQNYVSQLLAVDGHQVAHADTGERAVSVGVTIPVDLVIADSLAPSLAELRDLLAPKEREVPFVFLAAGANLLPGRLPIRDGDQVVAKPVAADDLRSAISAALHSSTVEVASVEIAGVTFDRSQQRLVSDGGAVQLTPIEFQLMDYLVRANGAIASTEDLLQNVWRYAPGTGSSDVIRSHLKNLRSKLREITASPDLIETVPRRGYRLALR
jgi:DNA-binding response OmpR family regulator